MAVKELVVSTDDTVLLSALVDHAQRRREPGASQPADAPERVRPLAAAALNARVEFEDLASGRREDVHLVHPASADAGQGRISVLSPVGRALLGRRAGQLVEVTLPNGDARELLVVAVDEG